MDHISAKKLAAAMDIIAQRITAIQRAKQKGGSWEKAQLIELVQPPGGNTPLPSGLQRLSA